MPDIRKLKDAVEACVDLQWLPVVEELLCRGSKAQRQEYAAQLAEWAEGAEVMAFTVAGGHPDGFGDDLDDPELWQELEAEGTLTEVLGYWNQAILYRYWLRALRSPVRALFKLGGEDCVFHSAKTRKV